MRISAEQFDSSFEFRVSDFRFPSLQRLDLDVRVRINANLAGDFQGLFHDFFCGQV